MTERQIAEKARDWLIYIGWDVWENDGWIVEKPPSSFEAPLLSHGTDKQLIEVAVKKGWNFEGVWPPMFFNKNVGKTYVLTYDEINHLIQLFEKELPVNQALTGFQCMDFMNPIYNYAFLAEVGSNKLYPYELDILKKYEKPSQLWLKIALNYLCNQNHIPSGLYIIKCPISKESLNYETQGSKTYVTIRDL